MPAHNIYDSYIVAYMASEMEQFIYAYLWPWISWYLNLHDEPLK